MISFIVTTKDDQDNLTLTLKQLARFTDIEHEVIVVDDFSTSPVFVPEGVTLLTNTVWVGQAVARNQGAAVAKGDTLIFLDGHIYVTQDAIKLLLAAPEDSIRGCPTPLIYDNKIFEALCNNELDVASVKCDDIVYGWTLTAEPAAIPILVRKAEAVYDVPYVPCCCMTITKKLFDELGGFDSGMIKYGSGSDSEIAMRCWSYGYSVKLVADAPCYHYTAPRIPHSVDPLVNPRIDINCRDGAFYNAMRSMHIHFPDALCKNVVKAMKKDFPNSWSKVPPVFPPVGLLTRKNEIDAKRVITKEALLARMTTP